jgi:hypothetical protein
MKSRAFGVLPVAPRPKPLQERFWWLDNRSPCSTESFKASGVDIADPKWAQMRPESLPTTVSATMSTVWSRNNFFLTIFDSIKSDSSANRPVELISGVVTM